MMNTTKEIVIEVLVRLILMILFSYYDNAEPFERQIQPEEAWFYRYPVTKSYVPSSILWCICILFPLISFSTLYIYHMKSRNDLWTAISAITLAFPLNAFLTSLLKIMVGRPRPDFVNRCFPHMKGTDFTKCIGDIDQVRDGRKSFPSGHSSFSFTVMVFMALFFARTFSVWTTERLRGLKLIICILPLLLAASIAISRTCDYHHHYEDVLIGSLMGTCIAYGVFKIYFRNDAVITVNGRIKENKKETELLPPSRK